MQTNTSTMTFAPKGNIVRKIFWSELPRWLTPRPEPAFGMGGKAQLNSDHGSIKSVTFSPDGLSLASTSKRNTIKLWDTALGDCMAILRGHMGKVQSVTLSPDSSRLASASLDGTIKLWETTSGKFIATLEGHRGAVTSVAFLPDDHRLASASFDSTIKL